MRLFVVDAPRDRLRDRQRLRAGTSDARDPRAAPLAGPRQRRGRGIPRALVAGIHGRLLQRAQSRAAHLRLRRAHSGLSLEDFQKRITVQELSPAGSRGSGPDRADPGRPRRPGRACGGGERAAGGARSSRRQRRGRAGCGSRPSPWSLARPEILTLKPYCACRLAAGADAPACQRSAVAPAPAMPPRRASTAIRNRSRGRLIERLAELYGRSGRQRARDPRQRRGHRSAVAHLSARRQRRDPAMHADLRHVPGGRAHPGRRGRRGAARARARLGARCRRACSRRGSRTSSWCSCARRTIRPAICSTPRRSRTLCTALDGKAIVVIDEAYIEWSRAPEPVALAEPLSDPGHPAHPVQGARAGRRALRRAAGDTRSSSNWRNASFRPTRWRSLSVEAALRALGPAAKSPPAAAAPRAVAGWSASILSRGLAASPWVDRVWPSDANFLLIDCRDADRFMRHSPGRRPDRARPARPSRAAAVAACVGGHPRAE